MLENIRENMFFKEHPKFKPYVFFRDDYQNQVNEEDTIQYVCHSAQLINAKGATTKALDMAFKARSLLWGKQNPDKPFMGIVDNYKFIIMKRKNLVHLNSNKLTGKYVFIHPKKLKKNRIPVKVDNVPRFFIGEMLFMISMQDFNQITTPNIPTDNHISFFMKFNHPIHSLLSALSLHYGVN